MCELCVRENHQEVEDDKRGNECDASVASSLLIGKVGQSANQTRQRKEWTQNLKPSQTFANSEYDRSLKKEL